MLRPIAILMTGLISEALLWGAVIIVVLGISAYVLEWYKLPLPGSGQTIQLVFDDVSQLNVGSPVNWMGVNVGYVSQIKPMRDRVEVTAEIEPNVGYIPLGSHFTVEFNGLAGSKSLEVQPPKRVRPNKHTKEINGFEVEEPIRLGDVLDTQMLVADGIVNAMGNIKNTIDNTGAERIEKRVAQENARMIRYNQDMAEAATSLANFNHRLHAEQVGLIENIQSFDAGLRQDLLPAIEQSGWVNGFLHQTVEQTGVWKTQIEGLNLPLANLKTLNQYLARAVGGSGDLKKLTTNVNQAFAQFKSKSSYTPVQQAKPQPSVTEVLQKIKDSLNQLNQQTSDLSGF